MNELIDLIKYIDKHAKRGACTCGRCMDAVEHPEQHQPAGHTANAIFFEVAEVDEPKVEDFKALVTGCAGKGLFEDLNLLDGKEHNYLEVGAWIGDQGYALMLMGLGALLGTWELITPLSLLPDMPVTDPLVRLMAGQGFVIIQAKI